MRKLLFIIIALLFSLSPYAQKKNSSKTQTTSKTTSKTSSKKSSTKSNSTKNNSSSKTATYSNASIRGLQGQRASIQKKIKEQQEALRKNQSDVQERLKNLMTINGEIEMRQKNINGITNDITHIENNIEILKAQLKTLEQQLADRRQKYIKSMRYMYRHHSVQDKLMFIFSANSFAQMYRRLRFVRQYAAYQKAQGEAVMAKQTQVKDKHKELEHVKGNKNNLLAKGEKEKTELEGKKVEQQEVVKTLQGQQKTIQSIIDEQQKKNAALNAQIDRLVAQEVAKARARAAAEAKKKAAAAAAAQRRAAELAQRKAALEAEAKENARRVAEAKEREQKMKAEAEEAKRAAEEARKAAEESKKKKAALAAAKMAEEREAAARQAALEAKAAREAAERKEKAEAERNKQEMAAAKKAAEEAETLSSVDRMMSGGFEANKGRLPIPITGSYKIVTHFGQHNVDGLNGVTLDNKGINIKGHNNAAARSIYDGEVTAVFGYAGTWVVMVRHGAYISVYCNLKNVAVHRGQKVTTGQGVGTVGADNILQFQLRRETTKLNPEEWLGR